MHIIHTYVLLPMLGSQRYPEIFDSGRLWLLNLANIRRPYLPLPQIAIPPRNSCTARSPTVEL